MAIRFTRDVGEFKQGQVLEGTGDGTEDAYVRHQRCAVFIREDGSEVDASGAVSHACPHCAGTGRAKAVDGPKRDKMVKLAAASK